MYELKRNRNKVVSLLDFKSKTPQSFQNNVASILDERCLVAPSAIAFIEASKNSIKTTTYNEFRAQVKTKAASLKAFGVEKNDVVLILQPISIQLYSSILAVLRNGASVMFVDPALDRKTINNCISQVNPKAMIACPKFALLSLLLSGVRSIPLHFIEGIDTSIFNTRVKSKNETIAIAAVKKEQPALITFTSGTSGNPKAINRTHGFLKTQLKVLANELDIKPEHVELTGLPMFVLANLASGASTVLSKTKLTHPGKVCGKLLYEEMIQTGSTSILGSPALVQKLIDYCVINNKKLPNLEKILTGGGSVSLSLLKAASQVCPKAKLITVYGSSEAEPIAHQVYDDTDRSDEYITAQGGGLLVGKPVDSVKLSILSGVKKEDKQTQEHIQNLHKNYGITFGEVVVTGDHVVKHYYQEMGNQSNKILMNSRIWHRTGDIGYLDSKGRLWITGAKPKTNLDTSFSFSIEQAVTNNFGGLKCACIKQGRNRILFIESGDRTEELENEIQYHLHWAKIDEIKFVKKLPVDKRHNTKIVYSKLVD